MYSIERKVSMLQRQFHCHQMPTEQTTKTSRASGNLNHVQSSWHAGLILRTKCANRGGVQTRFFQNPELACAAHQSDVITCGIFHGLQLACCTYT